MGSVERVERVGDGLGGDTGAGLVRSAGALLAEVGVTEKLLTLSKYP